MCEISRGERNEDEDKRKEEDKSATTATTVVVLACVSDYLGVRHSPEAIITEVK